MSTEPVPVHQAPGATLHDLACVLRDSVLEADNMLSLVGRPRERVREREGERERERERRYGCPVGKDLNNQSYLLYLPKVGHERPSISSPRVRVGLRVVGINTQQLSLLHSCRKLAHRLR